MPASPVPADSGVAVVVVTHDTRDEVLGCLATVPAAGADEVVVVDCGSRDGTAAAVRAAHPGVRVLELDNAGFARGANAGMRATTGTTVVVCNADVRFAADSLRRLAAVLAADPDLGAVGPAVVYPDGGHQASARSEPSVSTAVGHALFGRVVPDNRWTRRYRHLDADPAVARDVDWLSGCALALRRDAVVEVGGFDPGFFLYVEDVDLGARLRAAGWRLRYEPDARVVHRVGASTRRHRGRALLAHARSLDRLLARRHAQRRHARTGWHGRTGHPLRPAVRLAILAWAVATWVVERLGGAGRSTTGERITRDTATPRTGPTGPP